MGKPEHYSADLPARCLHLLDELQPHAAEIFMPGQDEGLGPLTATFALTMAIPIITLPCERIFKPGDDGVHYADDRMVREDLTKAVKVQMGLPKLSTATFFRANVWSFATVSKDDLFNLARGIPHPVAQSLSEEAAYANAANIPVSQWISCLRNALAHGGIAYLDNDGFPTHDRPVQMFAFVSGKYDRKKRQPILIELNVLRIRQDDFVQFLRDWVTWLQASGLDLKAAA